MLRESLDAWMNQCNAAYRVFIFFIIPNHSILFPNRNICSLTWLDTTSMQTKLTVGSFLQEWIVCHILSFFETGMWWKDWLGIARRTAG